MSFDEFKRKNTIKVNGIDVEVKSITARQRQEFGDFINENSGKPLSHAAWLVKHGTEKYHGHSVEQLLDMPDYALLEISTAIMEVSGIAKKKNAGAA